ncbi:MAG: lysylphosphatidylglycerol synthase transmembrane domain-containing protein [Bryobacterales bacterium]|nr:lysylphosphatidylglycerol synthase transmembrane domain-containing protein [Bryobacterales bacterium]
MPQSSGAPHETPPSQEASPQKRSWIIPTVGYVLSIGCLIWVYWGFPWHEELPKLLKVDWHWVVIGCAFEVGTYFMQGWRWSLILRPVGRVRATLATRAVYVGIFANEVLPMRTGEVLRCFLLAKWTRIRLSIVFSAAVLERVMDGVWLLALFGIAVSFVDLPQSVAWGAQALAVLVVVLAVALVALMFSKGLAHRFAQMGKWTQKFAAFILGFNALGRSKSLLWGFLVSLFYLLFQIVPIYALAHGYGVPLSVFAATTVLIILRLGTVVPQGPGNVGVTQAVLVLGLSLFGVDRNTATGLATVLFAVITVPLVVTGFIAFLITGMKLRDVFDRKAIEAHRD